MDRTVQNKINRWNVFYWPIWATLGVLWVIIQFPHSIRITLGKCLGRIAFLFPTQMKHTTDINLKLCFPELTPKEHQALAKKNFASLGIALMESAMAWLFSKKQLQSLYTIQGYEHAEKAFKHGKGILLITPHFTCVELAARFIGLEENFGILYRPHKKPWMASIQEYFRKKRFNLCIRNDNIRLLLSTLKKNKAIWFAYDIDEGGKRSVFAPFFGIPAASLTTVSDIVRLSGAAVIPMTYFRREDNAGYDIIFSPALENFPSDHATADATRLNAILEKAIRQKPEQYVWQYKRFKTRPKGQKRFYYSDNFPPRWKGGAHSPRP